MGSTRIPLRRVLILAVSFIVLLPPLLVFVQWVCNGMDRKGGNLADSDLRRDPPSAWIKTMTLRVLTFNIWDLYLVSGNRIQRMQEIGRVLAEMDPDIVGFQEAFIAGDRQILIDAMSGTRLKHHAYFPSGVVGSGLLISSAWPIRETFFRRFTHSGPWWRLTEGDWWAGKGVALARIETPAGIIDFFNTHAQAAKGRPEYVALRREQMQEIVGFMTEARLPGAPALLVGDINCRVNSQEYNALVETGQLHRAMTIDSSIDHIFAATSGGPDVLPIASSRIEETINRNGNVITLSDHPGYLSVLRIANTEKESAR